MASVSKLRAEAAKRDKQAAAETRSITKKSHGTASKPVASKQDKVRSFLPSLFRSKSLI